MAHNRFEDVTRRRLDRMTASERAEFDRLAALECERLLADEVLSPGRAFKSEIRRPEVIDRLGHNEAGQAPRALWHARPMRAASITTASALAGIAALHVGWGRGASFPFEDRQALADSVAGSSAAPGTRDCFAVAGLLACAAGLVADVLPVGTPARRAGVLGVALVLAGRGAAGVAGRTGSIVPWTPSTNFNDLDRRYYGPLCILLASGALLSVR
jgi:hypothetical protein